MKHFIAVLGSVVLGASLMIPAYGQDGIKDREENQKDRIQQGVKDGTVTKREAKRLHAEQKNIHQDVKLAKADGKVTGKERKIIRQEQNKASKDIYKQKHDDQNQK